MAKKDTKEELARLRRENARLRRQLRQLMRRQAREQHTAASDRKKTSDSSVSEQLTAQAMRQYRLFTMSSYPRYLWHSVRETSYYQRIRDFWINFRRYRLISRCVTVAAALMTVMGTSAVIVLGSLVCLLLVPAAVLLMGGTTLLGMFRRRRQNQRLREEIEGRTVYLFFPATLREPSFTTAMIREFSRRPESAVFVISPYSWSARGLSGEGFYINARREGAHLFLLRRHYFFFFRRLLDGRIDQRTVVVF